MRNVAVFIFGAFVALICSTALADDWRVQRVSGIAWVTSPGRTSQQPLSPDMVLPQRATVVTSGNGRVQISDGKSAMSLGPGSVATIETRGFSTTRVAQQAGKIGFEIHKRQKPHFYIQTPYLAAVVKGTSFTTSVYRSKASLNVSSGLVQVTDLRSGQTANVGAGQGAQSGTKTSGLSTTGKNAPSVTQGVASTPTVAPLGRSLEGFQAERSPSTQSNASSTGKSASGTATSKTGKSSAPGANGNGNSNGNGKGDGKGKGKGNGKGNGKNH